ncbi:MAG: hypothetical protein IAI48_05205, partial [Candidatus Eremiobacteraeota bacterium]|nr:hypothetical protein [Candidatus Eremiobacteraeota bacterium]
MVCGRWPRRSGAPCPSGLPPLPVPKRRTIGIAGVGLIGSSIGLRAAELGWDVAGWDVSAVNLDLARSRGAIATPAASLRELANGVETLVLAAPLAAIVGWLHDFAEDPPGSRLIIDVA